MVIDGGCRLFAVGSIPLYSYHPPLGLTKRAARTGLNKIAERKVTKVKDVGCYLRVRLRIADDGFVRRCVKRSGR